MWIQMTFTDLSFLYFVPLVFIGAFFLLNLTLAVIKSKFSDVHNTKESEVGKKKKKKKVREFENMDDETKLKMHRD